MYKIIRIITLYFVVATNLALAQNNWYQITPSNTFFSFSFPSVPQFEIDSPMLKMYKYQVDSQLTLYCIFEGQTQTFEEILQDEDPLDSLDFQNLPDSLKSPLFAYRDFMLSIWDSTLLDSYDTNFTDTGLSIKGIEFQISHFDPKLNSNLVLCARAYYNGINMVAFTIEGPSTRINDITAYKSDYFNSILFISN